MKKILIIFLSIFFLANFTFAQEVEENLTPIDESFGDFSAFEAPSQTYYEKAKILDIKELEIDENEEDLTEFGYAPSIQEIKLEILSGKYKGEEKIVENNMIYNPLGLKFKTNDKVVVYIEEFENKEMSAYIYDYWRLPPLVFLVFGFLALLVVFGKWQGVKTILSLALSIFLIFKFFIPRVLSGGNPIILALILSAVVTVMTLLMVGGVNKKSAAAIFGTIGGLVVAALLAVLAGYFANLTGLSSEESRLLFSGFPNLNMKGLLFAGIIIGALGAVMDVGISIASSITEIKKAHPRADFRKLFKSGIIVGRDIMGTMTNTLIFAYVGVSLPLLLLFTNLGESYLKFFNFEFVSEEVVRAITGSIGLVAALPLTALIAAYLESRK